MGDKTPDDHPPTPKLTGGQCAGHSTSADHNVPLSLHGHSAPWKGGVETGGNGAIRGGGVGVGG